MQLVFTMKPDTADFVTGIHDFLALLPSLSSRRLFWPEWKDAMQIIRNDEAVYVERMRQENFKADPSQLDSRPRDTFHASAYNEENEHGEILVVATYRWGSSTILLPHLALDLREPHPVHGLDISLFVETFDAVIAWKRPQHASMAPADYRMDLQPLDRARRGIGWLGWIPFEVSSEDVPEAAIVQPMRGGTFLASQRDWWFAAGPRKDEAAIARAQALDLRLNYLGLLPTVEELRRGDWGLAR